MFVSRDDALPDSGLRTFNGEYCALVGRIGASSRRGGRIRTRYISVSWPPLEIEFMDSLGTIRAIRNMVLFRRGALRQTRAACSRRWRRARTPTRCRAPLCGDRRECDGRVTRDSEPPRELRLIDATLLGAAHELASHSSGVHSCGCSQVLWRLPVESPDNPSLQLLRPVNNLLINYTWATTRAGSCAVPLRRRAPCCRCEAG